MRGCDRGKLVLGSEGKCSEGKERKSMCWAREGGRGATHFRLTKQLLSSVFNLCRGSTGYP